MTPSGDSSVTRCANCDGHGYVMVNRYPTFREQRVPCFDCLTAVPAPAPSTDLASEEVEWRTMYRNEDGWQFSYPLDEATARREAAFYRERISPDSYAVSMPVRKSQMTNEARSVPDLCRCDWRTRPFDTDNGKRKCAACGYEIGVPASPDRCPECGKAGAGDGCGTIQHPVPEPPQWMKNAATQFAARRKPLPAPALPVEGDGGDPVEAAWRHLFREVDGVNFDAPGASEERALVEAALRADERRVAEERIAELTESALESAESASHWMNRAMLLEDRLQGVLEHHGCFVRPGQDGISEVGCGFCRSARALSKPAQEAHQ